MVWDAPGHHASWPFELDFSLMDKAGWLDDILMTERFNRPVIIGQSMGGYVGQAYAQRFHEKLRGFVAIDSAPLQRHYVTAAEIWLLKRMEQEGLVKRNTDFIDKRRTIVGLTHKGKKLEEAAKTIPACITQGWSDEQSRPEDFAALSRMLDALISKLKSNDN